jgi:hypothetical protein
MAKLSHLVKALAEVTKTPEGTVTLLARQMREAGMISTGGRGPGAANMTPQDCTNLLLALVSRDRAGGLPARVANYRRSECDHLEWPGLAQTFQGKSGERQEHQLPKPNLFEFITNNMTLGALLDGLFERAADGRLFEYLKNLVTKIFGLNKKYNKEELYIFIRNSGQAAGSIKFRPQGYGAEVNMSDRPVPLFNMKFTVNSDLMESCLIERGDMHIQITITLLTIIRLGELIAVDPAE